MDFFEDEPVSLYLKDLTLIEAVESSHQLIQLLRHPWLGKILVINGEIQHIEKYQTLYHEMLVHLPAAFVPRIESVLIFGGGSLFAANEVLKYPSVGRVVLCDYDHNVLDIMRKHYVHAESVLNDTRFMYVEHDGHDYITKETDKYDFVINDCFNLALESQRSGVSYFKMLSNLCTDTGVCTDIVYRHIFDKQITIETLKSLQREKRLALSLVTVPEYPGILHMETIWGNSSFIFQNAREPINDYQKEIILGRKEPPFAYYLPNNLRFYLYLPPYIKKMFNL